MSAGDRVPAADVPHNRDSSVVQPERGAPGRGRPPNRGVCAASTSVGPAFAGLGAGPGDDPGAGFGAEFEARFGADPRAELGAGPMLIGLAAALGAAFMFGLGSIRLAIGARRVPFAEGLSLQLIPQMLRERAILEALALNLIGFGFHLVALWHIPLFVAQTGIASSLAITALLSVRVFGNKLSLVDWLAIVAVCLGLGLLAGAAGAAGTGKEPEGGDTGLVLAVVLLVILAFLATRVPGDLGAALIGLVAGLGFALVSIAARLVPEITAYSVVTSPATYGL